MAIFYGLGAPDFLTNGLSVERLLPVEPMAVSIEGSAEKKEAKKYRDGKIVRAGSARTSETYTLKIGIEAVNWLALQFAYGELAGVTSSASLPVLKYATVPSSSPYEIVDSNITSTNAWVTVMTAGSWGKAGPLTKVSSAPSAREFSVNTTGTKLVFNSAQAGAPIAYRCLQTITNIETIGVESVYTTFNAFTFNAIGYLDEELVKITLPKIQQTNIPTLNISDLVRLEIEYDIIVDTGFRTAFQVYNLTTAPVS